jgi:hypothetical protein
MKHFLRLDLHEMTALCFFDRCESECQAGVGAADAELNEALAP